MVGIVPRSAKLMELTGLFFGEAKGLIGRGVGTPAFEGTPVGHAGGMCAHHGFSASDLLSQEYGSKVLSSPETLSFTVPRTLWNLRKSSNTRSPDSDHRSVSIGVTIGSETDFSVILKSWLDLRS